MEITSEIKSLLQAVEPQIEAAFAEGVTQAGDFLPALPGYTTIPDTMRPQGRQGILSTFASLLKGVLGFRPTVNSFNFQNGYSVWGDPNFQDAGWYLDLNGDVVLIGLVANPAHLSDVDIAVLPEGYRPAKTLLFTSMSVSTPITISVKNTGGVAIRTDLASAGFASLSGIRFKPA